MNILTLKNIKYTYADGSSKNDVLKGLNINFESGKFYVIAGNSGSGKTTLISLISGLDKLQEGDISYNDQSIKKITNAAFRLKYVNIVFQAYNLITYLTALENVLVAMDIAKVKKDNNRSYAYSLLQQVGIDQAKANRSVLKLSGGEQQRVAIARSMASDVPIIVADEPTGNLDEDIENNIIKLFKTIAHDNKIVIVVSHSKNVAEQADVVYKMKKGIIEI